MTLQLLNTSQSLHLTPIESLIQWQIHRLHHYYYSPCSLLTALTFDMAELKTTTASRACNYHGGWRGREGISCAEKSLIKPRATDFYSAMLVLRPGATIPSFAQDYQVNHIFCRKVSNYQSSSQKYIFYLRKNCKNCWPEHRQQPRVGMMSCEPAGYLSCLLTNRGELQVRKLL